MTLKDILRHKGTEVYSITPDETVADAVQSLVAHNCGSLLVIDPRSEWPMAGIITERDILRLTAAKRAPLDRIKVKEVMTVDLTTGALSDSVDDVMGLMTEKRIRHLPILEDDQLQGIISIGDVVKSHVSELATENHYLKEYIQS
jgi:CBS domain-containing protein